jgi:hypothetical protein
MQLAHDQVVAASSLGTFFDQLVMLLPTFNDVLINVTSPATTFWTAISTGTLSHYTDALADGGLWSDIQCAIYASIKATGYFTASNIAAAIAAVYAVSWAHTDVRDAVVAYMTGLDIPVFAAIQIQGTTWHGDCGLSCIYGSCFGEALDPTFGWSSYTPGLTTFTSGTGWVGAFDTGSGPPDTETGIVIPGPFNLGATNTVTIDFPAPLSSPSDGGVSFMILRAAGHADLLPSWPASGTTGDVVITFSSAWPIDTIYIVARSLGNVAAPIIESLCFGAH